MGTITLSNSSNLPLPTVMRQVAPFPVALATLVQGISYKPGWVFHLLDIDRGQGCEGLTLVIRVNAPDTNAPERRIQVAHYMPVPAAAYNGVSWRRWLFDQILLAERHEAAEFMRVEGVQPLAPVHAPGFDPYQVFEPVDVTAQQTNFRGEFVGDLSPQN